MSATAKIPYDGVTEDAVAYIRRLRDEAEHGPARELLEVKLQLAEDCLTANNAAIQRHHESLAAEAVGKTVESIKREAEAAHATLKSHAHDKREIVERLEDLAAELAEVEHLPSSDAWRNWMTAFQQQFSPSAIAAAASQSLTPNKSPGGASLADLAAGITPPPAAAKR